MNKTELLQKIKDEVAKERGYESWAKMMAHFLKNKLMVLSWSMIEKAHNRYAIAMCEEQKKHDAETVYDDNHVCVGDIGIGILNTKNVAE